MTTDAAPNPAWLDAYLDGSLDAAQARAFEHWLASPDGNATRAALQLQRQIDASLRRAIPLPDAMPGRDVLRHATTDAPPPTADLDPRLPFSAAPRTSRPASLAARTRRWAIAAGLLLAATAFLASRLSSSGAPGLLDPQALYANLIDRGYTISFACSDDAEFAGVMNSYTDEWLVVTPHPGLSVLGWRYAYNSGGGVLSPDDLILMTRVTHPDAPPPPSSPPPADTDPPATPAPGEEVIVLLDRSAKARRLREGRWGNLNVFRRDIGAAVMYEVTPLDHATVLPHFAQYSGPKPAPNDTKPPAGG